MLFDENKCTICDKKNDLIVIKIKKSSNNIFPLVIFHDEKLALQNEQIDENDL